MGSVVKSVGSVAGNFIPGADVVGSAAGLGIDAITGSQNRVGTSSSQTANSQKVIAGRTPEEIQRQQYIDQVLGQQTGAIGQSQQQSFEQQALFNNLFRDLLLQTVSGAAPTPEQRAEAESFVDQTFTEPAKLALEKQTADFQGNQETKAAALGRQSTDVGFQEELFRNIVDAERGIQSERGAQIANRLDQNRALGMSGALEGSRFFNTAATQASNNLANLLNIATTNQGMGLNERLANQGTSILQNGQNFSFMDPSLGSRVSAGANAVSGLGEGLQKIFSNKKSNEFVGTPNAGSFNLGGR